jgi:hypothetical protein
MYYGGSHLGFPIGIKNIKFVENLPMIIPGQLKNVSKRFFSETTRTIETKLPRNDHWKVLYKICVFYVDRKSKMAAGFNVNLCITVAAILDFRSA